MAWPEKLITQAEAFVLAAAWPVGAEIDYVGHVPGDTLDINLYCRKDGCNQSCGQLSREGTIYNGSLDEMLSMVLRHMVMAHDVQLSGLRAKTEAGEHGQ